MFSSIVYLLIVAAFTILVLVVAAFLLRSRKGKAVDWRENYEESGTAKDKEIRNALPSPQASSTEHSE